MKKTCFLLILLWTLGCDSVLRLESRMEPDRIELMPDDTLLVEGEYFLATLTAYSVDDQVISIPRWLSPIWSSSGGLIVDGSGLVTADESGRQHVSVSVGKFMASATIRVNPLIELSAAGIYINQAIQAIDDPVPLVAMRPGLLRVFVTLEEGESFYSLPELEVRVGSMFSERVRQKSTDFMDRIDESDLGLSYNLDIPGELIQPGLTMELIYDPDDVIHGLSGRETFEPEVIAMPVHHQTLVPTISTIHPKSGVYRWIEEDHDYTRKILPINESSFVVHDTVFLDIDLTEEDGWYQWINDIEAIWLMEGKRGYYYGVSKLPYGSGIVGLGLVGGPVSVGEAKEKTYAHELGHNMNLKHAPCGGAGRADPLFPNQNGRIDGWGWDVDKQQLVHPRTPDIMGYCSRPWISGYHFQRALKYRLNSPWIQGSIAENVLIIGGYAKDTELQLRPVFASTATPTPEQPLGLYLAEGVGPDGSVVSRIDSSRYRWTIWKACHSMWQYPTNGIGTEP